MGLLHGAAGAEDAAAGAVVGAEDAAARAVVGAEDAAAGVKLGKHIELLFSLGNEKRNWTTMQTISSARA